MLLMKTKEGVEHGLLNTYVNHVSKDKVYKKISPKKKEEIEKKAQADSKLVSVRYINYKNQKRGMRCVDWSAGPGMPYYAFRFLHNHSYHIPEGVLNVVNNEQFETPNRADSLDDSGIPRSQDEGNTRMDEFVRDF